MNESTPSSAGPPEAGSLALALGPPRRGFAMGLMIVSSVMISFGGLIVRNIEAADPWQINFYRAVALVTVVSLVLRFHYPGRVTAQVRRIGRPGLLGGVALATAGVAFLESLTHTTVANTLFTLSAIPFITAGLARLVLKEGLARATLITMCFAALGILVMMAEGIGVGSIYGNAMALLAAVGFSSFAVVVRRHRDIDMLPTLLISGMIIAVVTFTVRAGELGIPLGDVLLCLLWGGIISGLANWMFIVASRHLVAAEVTLFMLLEFALGPIWVWLFVAEAPTRWTLVGGVLVIASVTVRAVIELRRAGRPVKRGRLAGPG